MTPGHSNSILATYLAGSSSGIGRSPVVSLVFSFIHADIAVLIALLSLPLVPVEREASGGLHFWKILDGDPSASSACGCFGGRLRA